MNMQHQTDHTVRQPRSGRSTPAIQHAPAPIQSVRRSGNATPMPQQYQPVQSMMPQQDYQPQAISHAAQLPPRSSMSTPQPKMLTEGYSKSVPPTASENDLSVSWLASKQLVGIVFGIRLLTIAPAEYQGLRNIESQRACCLKVVCPRRTISCIRRDKSRLARNSPLAARWDRITSGK